MLTATTLLSYLFSLSASLLLGVGHADQFTVANVSQAVTSGADLLVHLVTTSNGLVVERFEETIVGPWVVRWMLVQIRGLHRLVKSVKQAQGASANNTSCAQVL